MNEYIALRILKVADHIIATGDTVRGTARLFGISKSTVHKDCSERLKYVDKSRWVKVKKILLHNLNERHIRGGNATKRKYLYSKMNRRPQ